MLQLRMVW